MQLVDLLTVLLFDQVKHRRKDATKHMHSFALVRDA